MATQFPVPRSVLRGHKAQVHVAVFIRGNKRLVTGDAEGFIIVWDLTILRPRGVWQAHQKAILGIREWGADRIITHGRDNEIIAWKLTEDDESSLEKSLPVQGVPKSHPKPWVQHVLPVNSMNFCAFADCDYGNLELGSLAPSEPGSCELLIAAPNALTLEAVDIFGLPSQHRLFTVKPTEAKGMSMALAMFKLRETLHLVAAYESGMVTVSRLDHANCEWATIYQHQAHTQPVLSLDISPSLEFFITSSADAVLAKHPIPLSQLPLVEPSTSGDNSPRDLESESACGLNKKSGLSAMFTSASSDSEAPLVQPPPTPVTIVTTPIKVINTRHAGQQSIRIRSDGSIFATAGWDSRVRIYSTKTMKEVAVLKWHTVGCFAVAFSSISGEGEKSDLESDTLKESRDGQRGGVGSQLVKSGDMEMTVKERRIRQAQTAHWLAAGSKDGKISLWDIF